jgi:hypothetical protein
MIRDERLTPYQRAMQREGVEPDFDQTHDETACAAQNGDCACETPSGLRPEELAGAMAHAMRQSMGVDTNAVCLNGPIASFDVLLSCGQTFEIRVEEIGPPLSTISQEGS